MKKRWIILLSIIGCFVLLHFLLEPIAEHYVNKELNNLENYSGSIDDIDIRLYRGAYQIKGIEINKINNEAEEPFLKIDTLDLSVQWNALFDGRVVGEVYLANPEVNMIITPTVADDSTSEQTGTEEDWLQTIQNLMPLTINTFEINNGKLTYRDPTVSPDVDMHMRELDLILQNISNVKDSTNDLPSTLHASTYTVGDGHIKLDMKMNLLNKIPEFTAKLELDSLNLVALNDFIQAYAKFDVQKGSFTTIAELSLDDKQISGYIKPFFEELDVFDLKEDLKDEGSIFQKIWEALVGGGAEVLENQPEDQVATRIPIQGSLDQPDPDISRTVWNILSNAFVDAFEKKFEVSAQANNQKTK